MKHGKHSKKNKPKAEDKKQDKKEEKKDKDLKSDVNTKPHEAHGGEVNTSTAGMWNNTYVPPKDDNN
jgi:hypothetical protein